MHKLMRTRNKRKQKAKKGKQLRKITAMLLSAMLIVGTAEGAVPGNVMAREYTEWEYEESPEDMSEPAPEILEEEPDKADKAEIDQEEPTKAEPDNEEPDKAETGNEDPDSAEEIKMEPAANETASRIDEHEDTEDTEDTEVTEDTEKTETNEQEGVQADPYSGTDWVLDRATKKLTIESDTGMEDWCATRNEQRDFYYSNEVETVDIKNGVSYIKEKAFQYLENLPQVLLPDSVTKIERRAFLYCTVLTDIKLPDGITSIGEEAFCDCKNLTQITIPNKVTRIEDGTFQGCIALTDITLPDGITSIGEDAFCACYVLTDITLDSVTSIGGGAFSGCAALTDIKLPDGITSIEDSTFLACIALTDIKLPDSVTGIGQMAFAYCENLTSIKLPNSVTSIGAAAFGGCSSLESITIPNSVTSIGQAAFAGCENLTSIKLPDSVTSIGAGAFSECSSLENITIPDSVTSIGAGAFSECSSLKSIIMQRNTPPQLEEGEQMFENCKFVTDKVKGIKVPAGSADAYKTAWTDWADYIMDGIASGTGWTLDINGKLTIESNEGMTDWISNGRADCKEEVKSVEISNSVTGIGAEAFKECANLTAVEIPNNVISIGAEAFSGCTSLTSVTMQPTNPPTLSGGNVFQGCKFVTDNTKGIFVPKGKVETYKTAWTDWADYIITIIASGTGWTFDSEGTLTIESDDGRADWIRNGKNTYEKKVKSAKILDGVTNVTAVLWDASNVESVELPDSVTSIGYRAFCRCWNLTDITIPDGVTSIEDEAFYNCDSLPQINIPSGLTSIGDSAFGGCSALKTITIPSGVTSAGSGVFAGCFGLTHVTIPDGMTAIWSGMFSHCTELIDIELPDSLESIEEFAFSGCSRLMMINIPSGVTNIGACAFERCSDLRYITIPSGVESIEAMTFLGCRELTHITIPDNVTGIGEEAFKECANLTAVEIPNSVTSIGAEAFSGCTSLTSVTMQPTNPPTLSGGNVFEGCKFVTDNTKGIHVPDGAAEDYKTAWTEWADYIADDSPQFSDAEKVTVAKTAAQKALADITATNATTQESIQTAINDAIKTALEEAGIDSEDVSITIKDFAKTDATTAAAGSVTGTITIASGESTDELAIDKTITKLELTDAEKAAAAKTAVEKALENINVSNATTKESLQTAIDDAIKTALEEAGINSEDISITIEDFAKTEATANTAGSVTGKVTIASGESTAEVRIDKTITKLELTDAEKAAVAKTAVEKALENINVSNATTKESLQTAINDEVKTALEEAGIDGSGIIIAIEDFAKTDATTSGAGSVTGTVAITCGTETERVQLNKTIEKLPTAPADKVETVRAAVQDAVKKAVEEALEGTKVTNDNAQQIANQIAEELIPTAVAKALEETGISPADITIGEVDIKVSPSTEESDGSIDVTIPITSTEDPAQTGNAQIQVLIGKTGGAQDPDKDAEQAENTIKDTLGKLEITNDTTTDDIRSAIQEALGDDAVIGDIKVVEKVEATEENPGSLSLKINITINGKTIIINIAVPIKKTDSRTGVYVRFTDYDKLDENDNPCYKYTGTAIKPAVEVYHNETRLTEGSDYTISYKNNTKVGSAAALTVKGKGNFTGTSNVVNFTIINADIDADTKHPTKMTVVAGTKVTPVILNGTKKLTAKDYALTGEGLDDKGKYTAATADGAFNTLTVKGVGSYEGSSFDIQVKVIDKSAAKKFAVTVDKSYQPVYNGTAINLSSLFQSGENQNGAIAVTDAADPTKLLKEGEDFTAVCTSSLTNAGTVKFTLTGMGEYTGTVSKNFKINPLKVTDSSKFAVTFDEDKVYEYKASGTTVDHLAVKYLGESSTDADGQILRPGIDYKVSYSNHKKVSDAKDAELKITFLGNYKGSAAVSKTFKVKAAKLSAGNTTVTVPDKVYKKAGSAYKSTPIVTVDGVTIKSSNYDVSYKWATASKAGNDAEFVTDDKVNLAIADGDSYAKVKVTITPKGCYTLAEGAVIEGEYYVRKAEGAVDLSKAKVTFHDKAGNQLKNFEYNGAAFYTPEGNNPDDTNASDNANAVYVRVSIKDKTIDPSLYDVIWTNATAKGKATVVIRGKGTAGSHGIAVGSKNQSIGIKPMAFKGRSLKTFMEKTAESLKNILF